MDIDNMNMDLDTMSDQGDKDDVNGDGEGVWSPDIEQCFKEALLLFPPCGRRKHILQEEGGGKMYGRNELIARHIMMRTGKKRTRKQVSSHIQVLARRKAKQEAASVGGGSSGPSPSPSGISLSGGRQQTHSAGSVRYEHSNDQSLTPSGFYDVWLDRPIVTQKIRLVEFSAFTEHSNFQPTSNNGPINGLGLPNNNNNNNNTSTVVQQTPGAITLTANSRLTADPDLSLQIVKREPTNQHQQMQPYLTQQQQQQQHYPATTHPLASNHHVPAQFNQASYQATNNQLQPHHHQRSHQSAQVGHYISTANNSNNNSHNNNHHQQQQSSTGFTRHSYVKIDYKQTLGRQMNKLERIDISQIQDKFPEIGGPEGLFQRGPSDAFFLVKFWADINNDYEYNIDDQNSYFGFSSHFETIDYYRDITCSTKACSYGLQVVEKIEKIYSSSNSVNGRYSYIINRSPMCEFMIQFIKKLRQLPRASQMNSVLENFTVLQVITSESTSEILLCLAYVFEVASTDQNNRPQYHVYKLTKD